MAQAIQISQTKFEEILNRLGRLEKLMVKLLDRIKAEEIPMVDEETEKLIAQGLEEYKKGNYTEIRNDKELKVYLKSL